jgi:hypothetical protein
MNFTKPSTSRQRQESSRATATAERASQAGVSKMFHMAYVPVPVDKAFKPTAQGVYRTPTGRLCRMSQRKQEDGNSYHFDYITLDPHSLPVDGVGRKRAYTGKDIRGDMGTFALSVGAVGILREAGVRQ